MDVIHSLLGDLYNLHPILVDMDHCGHGGASRKRIYVIVVASKTQTKCLVDPITLYRALVEELHQRQTSLDCTTAPGDYLTADPMEIQLDAMEVARAWALLSEKGTGPTINQNDHADSDESE